MEILTEISIIGREAIHVCDVLAELKWCGQFISLLIRLTYNADCPPRCVNAAIFVIRRGEFVGHCIVFVVKTKIISAGGLVDIIS
ncbi:hypothetical protein X942_5936 [Burkholderia pseudomallei MSHR5596]|nr:hypothetical protein X942_5936 [Burkholderia pseudomallei MSHR5596]